MSHFNRSSIVSLIKSVANYENVGMSMITKRAIKDKVDGSVVSANFQAI